MPVGHPRAQGPRGGLSRNKVAVGESAAGSPPATCLPGLNAGKPFLRAPGDESRRGRVNAFWADEAVQGLGADWDWLPAVIPAGGWLGSGAEEGRAKLRKARGRRREP